MATSKTEGGTSTDRIEKGTLLLAPRALRSGVRTRPRASPIPSLRSGVRTRAEAPSLRASAPVFAALGDETRLRLVSRLCERGPLSIARLTAGSDLTRQAITKHLHVLGDAGLVRSSREGRETVWELEPRRLEAARRYLELVSARWDDAIGRLRAYVER